jgi:hypothetical protein
VDGFRQEIATREAFGALMDGNINVGDAAA